MAKHFDNEDISTLVDDEISHRDQKRLLKVIAGENNLLKKYEHYHIIRDALTHQYNCQLDINLTDKIRERLKHEPSIASKVKRRKITIGISLIVVIVGFYLLYYFLL